MWNTFKYTMLYLLRSPGLLIWSLLFPLILSTVFMMMFGPLDDMTQAERLRVAVVEMGNDPEDRAFQTFIDELSTGDDALLDVTYAKSADDARDTVQKSIGTDDAYTGYIVFENGKPEAFVVGEISQSGLEGMYSSILSMLVDQYVAKSHLITELAKEDPSALANSEVMDSLFATVDATKELQITNDQPKESTRFYYALLGMAAMFGGGIGLTACQRLRANTSPLGARREIGATGHATSVAATILASWVISFICLAIAYAYMRFVANVDFGNHDAECLMTIGASSLMATALGCAISSIPHVSEDGKTGMLTGIVCFTSLFAGLYGQPTMELADSIATSFPMAGWINPAVQVSQAFYSIMYYDTPEPLLSHILALLVMSLVLFLLSSGALRRQRYASI